MAQKDYSKMSNKKLATLLETADENEAQLIQAELDRRIDEMEAEEATEQEATEEATEETTEKVEQKSNKLTDDERKALADELRATAVNHRCEVVPFNTIEWVPGVVSAIIEDKRANRVMYAIKTDDGRRIVKAYPSNLVKLLEETVEPAKRGRSTKAKQLDENGNIIPEAEWAEEEIEAAIQEVIDNVGKKISYPKSGAFGTEVVETLETGRIVSLVPNKRQKTILYRIWVDQPEDAENKVYAHKVTTLLALNIEDELDEEGQKINEAFKNRRYREVVEKVAQSPEEAFKAAEASYNKAKENLAKAQATLEKREAAYLKAKEAYEESLNEATAENTESLDDELA